jgi:hypothetical protein
MQRIFQRAKRLISMCLVTLLIVTSALTISPTSARAEGDIITTTTTIIDCRYTVNPKCGNTNQNYPEPPILIPKHHPAGIDIGFEVAVFLGTLIVSISADALGTVISTGAHAVAVTAVPMAAAAAHAVAVAAAPAMAVADPVLLPVAATVGVGYVGYRVWEAYNHSEPNPSI